MSTTADMQRIVFQEHDFDDDCVCKKCGFDGAEWWHLEKMKPRDEREQQPACRPNR